MGLTRTATDELYQDYWENGGRQLSVDQMRTTSLMVLGLQVAFSCLDAIVFPEWFGEFLALRMSVNALMLVILFWLRFRRPKLCELLLAAAVGGEILTMVYATGGPTSNYYVGLIILFVGMPVLMPMRSREAFVVSGFFCAGFAVSPLFVKTDFAAEQFVVSLFFVISGGVECVLSSGLLTRARLTEYRQRNELERARDRLAALDEVKARFSANVHHELRTPLTLILAPLDALRTGEFGELPEVVRGTLRTMHVNGRRLLKMINNLLDLAKLESQEFTIHRQPVDLVRLAGELVDGARDLAARKGVELRLRAPAEAPGLNADPDALEKILMNLLGNALKFTEQGSVSVGVEAVAEGVHLWVADSGVGLEADQLEAIFNRFSQVDSSATRKFEGTGIGLSLAHELVGLHGGRIWATSEGLGHGATMHVELPTGRADGEGAEEVLRGDDGRSFDVDGAMEAVEGEVGLASGGAGGQQPLSELERTVERWEGERGGPPARELPDSGASVPADAPEVLVVEDNADMRSLLIFLVGREFRVRSARNGREALERIAEGHPDLILTDVMMPEMSGTELCAAVKGDPETAELPVVLVTSKAEGEMKVEGLELGADDYVTKPFHPRELMARVRSLVAQRLLKRQLVERNTDLETALAELKQAEVQLVQAERLAAVGELAAGVAHEVNNPVNFALNAARAMRGSVAELSRLTGALAEVDWRDDGKRGAQLEALSRLQQEIGVEELAGTLDELAEIVSEGLDRTHGLVGDLRDFAAPGRGAGEPVDLAKGLTSTLQLVRGVLDGAGVRASLELPPDLPHPEGDSGALNQVFLNLIKNAAEAFEGGGGSITVQGSVVAGGVEIAVRDDGPGISEEVRRRMFEPFFTTKEEGKGTGLGLSMSRQIVEAHGGRLEVESEQGRGSSVRVWLPLPDAAS